jgi:hypothetical protein
MTRAFVLLFVGLAATSGAGAAWTVLESQTEPFVRFAVVKAKEDSLIRASLHMSCDSQRKRYISLIFSERMPEVASLSWQIDKQPPTRFEKAPLYDAGFTSVRPALEPRRLTKAKTVHVEWLAKNGERFPYDFDVSGASRALARVTCPKA